MSSVSCAAGARAVEDVELLYEGHPDFRAVPLFLCCGLYSLPFGAVPGEPGIWVGGGRLSNN